VDSLEQINSKTRQAYNLLAQKYHDLFHNEMYEKEYDRKFIDSFISRFKKDAVILDAGCGPSGHIGRYIFDKGVQVIGVDLSEKCVEMARQFNPAMQFEIGDIGNLAFEDGLFDGVISYYSIIDTPKNYVHKIFNEFRRVLKPNGYLLVTVKAGATEGYIYHPLGDKVEIYMSLFSEEEISNYYTEAGFLLEFIEKRNPYDFEISNERIFAIGKKE
jgi:SAM-dependent methyltransferase